MRPIHRQSDPETTMAGSLLLAHPFLKDPNFARSVILLSAHSKEQGALGVVLNRPMGTTLGEYDPALQNSHLADLPLFHGGPVATDQLILAAWKWTAHEGSFQLYFGINEEKATALLEQDPGLKLRGFFGYSGWSAGQLESELQLDSWLISQIDPAVDDCEGVEMWRAIAGRMGPRMRYLVDEPDDPSRN